MSEFAIIVLAVLAACVLFAVVSNVADAVENIRIAKHTGRDPRPPRPAAKVKEERP